LIIYTPLFDQIRLIIERNVRHQRRKWHPIAERRIFILWAVLMIKNCGGGCTWTWMLVNLLISVFGKTKTMYSNAQRIPVQFALLWGGGYCVMQERGASVVWSQSNE